MDSRLRGNRERGEKAASGNEILRLHFVPLRMTCWERWEEDGGSGGLHEDAVEVEEQLAKLSGGVHGAQPDFGGDVVEEAEFGIANVVAVGEGVTQAAGLEGRDQGIFAVVHYQQFGLQVGDILTGGYDVEVAKGLGREAV